MLKRSDFIGLILFAVVLFPALGLAASITLNWDANSESDLAYYHVYYGTASRSYGSPIPASKDTHSYQIKGLDENQTYYFSVSAVDNSGNESGFSEELSALPFASTPPPDPEPSNPAPSDPEPSNPAPSDPQVIALPDTGAYGLIKEGDKTHKDKVEYSFDGMSGKVTLKYQPYDIDKGDEAKILINGKKIGYMAKTSQDSWGRTRTITLKDSDVKNSGTNVITFDSMNNSASKGTSWWGVREVSATGTSTSTPPPSDPAPSDPAPSDPQVIALPDTGAYGMIKGADQTHSDKVEYSFEGMTGKVTLKYQPYDIDKGDEAKIRINGKKIGYMAKTSEDSWGRTRTITLKDSDVKNSGTNVITFDSMNNSASKGTSWWGVRQVTVTGTTTSMTPSDPAPSDPGPTDPAPSSPAPIDPSIIALPDTGAYGMIKGGDQSHADRVEYVFEGRSGKVTLTYQPYDIDVDDEVRIQLNGKRVAWMVKTSQDSWGGTRTITLKDSDVKNSGTNVITFDSTYNSATSGSSWWGVRNVTVN